MNLTPEQILAIQQDGTQHGTVTYEEGLHVEQKTGYLILGPNAVVIFYDPETLLADQDRLYIPIDRVYNVALKPNP